MYYCPECNIPFEKGTKFCNNCGCNLHENFIINPICPKCKKEFPDGAKFCAVDGELLVSPEKLISKCEICNQEYSDGTKYCPKDGGKVIAETFRRNKTEIVKTKNINLNPNKIEQQFNLFQWLYWGGFITSIIIIGLFGLVAAQVFFYIILYKAWSIIPEKKTDITPGKAIGFLFIPFFNLYWNFMVYKGLGEKISKISKENNLHIPPIRGAEAIPVLTIVSVIPYVNIIPIIALIILNYLFIKDVKNAMISIIDKGDLI